MSEHTPGPWEVFELEDTCWPGIDSSNGLSIVLYGEENDDYGVHGDTQEEAMANARLIAAAPALLAACELADLNFQRILASGELFDDDHEAWNAIRAAIAQARPTPSTRSESE